MGKRFTARRLAMQILYQLDMGQKNVDNIKDLTFQTDNFLQETKDFASYLVQGVLDNKDDIDQEIKTRTKYWPIERLSVIDKNLMNSNAT